MFRSPQLPLHVEDEPRRSGDSTFRGTSPRNRAALCNHAAPVGYSRVRECTSWRSARTRFIIPFLKRTPSCLAMFPAFFPVATLYTLNQNYTLRHPLYESARFSHSLPCEVNRGNVRIAVVAAMISFLLRMYDEWPVLEFADVRESILSNFSTEAANNVSYLLVRELVENVDKPHWNGVKLENDQQVEWVMQVIGHAFSLSLSTAKDIETIRAAIRIYLCWSSALTPDVHASVPEALRTHPDRYFRKMIESLRSLFLPKGKNELCAELNDVHKKEMELTLRALQNLTLTTVDEYKDEVWSRSLLFLMASTDQMLSNPQLALPESIGTLMAPELIHTLFDSWIHAAFFGFIPSPAYWKTLSTLCQRWTHHVSVVECWARKLLSLSVLIVQGMYGKDYCQIVPSDLTVLKYENLSVPEDDDSGDCTLQCIWFRLLHLLGNPAKFLSSQNSPEENHAYIEGQKSLCFFVAVTAVSKLVNLFYGDSSFTIDFNECEEMYNTWLDSCKGLKEEWLKQQQQMHRSSSISAASSMMGGDSSTLTVQQASTSSVPPGASSPVSLSSSQSVMHRKTGTTTASSRSRMSDRSVNQTSPGISENINMLERPRAGQYVWHCLRNNTFYVPPRNDKSPKVNRMLELFLDILVESTIVNNRSNVDDVLSERSMSSIDLDTHSTGGNTGAGTASNADGSSITRRSFANSTTSSSEVSSPFSSSVDYPSVDGVAAGRAAALGALCRIICAKTSKEQLPDEQLAQFYTVVHDALLERDRLMMCSLLFYSSDLFKLGLKGVEVLLPNYLMAIDIILTESMKLRLHPSIHEVEMRHACIKALAAIISWPTTFGPSSIIDASFRTLSTSPYKTTNALETSPSYIDLRQRILRNLVHLLRNETDPGNLHLALSLCNVFCEESCRYDLCYSRVLTETSSQQVNRKVSEHSPEPDTGGYCTSALKAIVSAICDNMCKPSWAGDLSICLAAIDTLNSFTNIHHSVLFNKKDMSTGSLIVTSLCRFIDTQLMKPPMYHSRDLHSSVVAAFSSLTVWLCSAPMLTEVEPYLLTVAETIELGLMGDKNLVAEKRKPASQRVYEAAECLFYTLFAVVGQRKPDEIVDERRLLYKYGPDAIDTTRFKHFVIHQNTIVSLHEASHIIPGGVPSLLCVTRTPFHAARTQIIQLRARFDEPKNENEENVNEAHPAVPARISSQASVLSTDSSVAGGVKQFEMPPGFDKSTCKLDTVIPKLEGNADTDNIIAQLKTVREKIARGESIVRATDERNVWLSSGIGQQLCKPLQPLPAVSKCATDRVFLYDMGLLNEKSFGDDVLLLDSQTESFYQDLHNLVDRSPEKMIQTVYMFYVRDGQRSYIDILENSMNLQSTSGDFCRVVSELGTGVEVPTHAHWTGNWSTAFSADRKPLEKKDPVDHYIIDGLSHCLWWADSLMEIAFVMPTERSHLFYQNTSSEFVDEDGIKRRHSLFGGAFTSSPSQSSSGFMSAHRDSPVSSENSFGHQHYLNVATESPSSLSPSLSVNTHSPLSSYGGLSPSRQFIPRSARRRSRSRPSSVSSNSPPPSPNTTTSSSVASSISPFGGASKRRQQMLRQNTMGEMRTASEGWHHTKILARKFSEPAVDPCSDDSLSSNPRQSMIPNFGYLKSFFRGRTEAPKLQAPTIEIIGDEEENELRSIGMIEEQSELVIECPSDIPNRPETGYKNASTMQSRRATLLRGQTVPSYYQTRDTTHSGHSIDSSGFETSRNSDVSQHSVSHHILKSVRTKSSSSAANSEGGTKLPQFDKLNKRSSDKRVFIVWLERIEDKHNFPLEDMFPVSDDGSCPSIRSPGYRPDFVVIYLNRFESDLVRVHVDGVWTKCGPPGPLCDGMVVSLTSVATLLRLTVMNITRRKAVELDNYQMVHNKRKLAIQDISKKYAAKMTYSAFLERLLTSS
uniref:RALGAPB_N domain-containing protein n=1 Tax=Steinernema glaseri TaxID=37863 RepID=A0A1I7Z3Y0_9BILA